MMPVPPLVASQGPVLQQHSVMREQELLMVTVQLHLEFAALVSKYSISSLCYLLSVVAADTCVSSGAAVTHNNTYMRNPSYPSAYPTSTSTTPCAYKVTKLSDNICQVRLDFQTLELGQTASSGACTDSIQATLSAESSVT